VVRQLSHGNSILAEIKFLCRLFAERITEKLPVTFRAKIVAKIFVGGFDEFRFFLTVLHVAEQLADGFHVIIIQV